MLFLAAESRSIYIRGLPLNAEAAQVEEEFKKFGPIKPRGVQVRSNRVCFTCTFAVPFTKFVLGHTHCFY